MASNKPALPVLVLVSRGQAPAWETVDPQTRDQRIQQLENDPGIQWFEAYEVKRYRIVATKKTIVVNERPDVEEEV